MDRIPIWIIFLFTVSIIFISIELGCKLGKAARIRSIEKKSLPVSSIASSILGMLGFILAFTFNIVSNRYDTKKLLVREEANAIGTAWLRSRLLPDSERTFTSDLYKQYIDIRLNEGKTFKEDELPNFLKQSRQIQRRLWSVALVNAKRDLNSDAGALYLESINKIIDIHALRVSQGLRARLPWILWLVFYALIILSMVSIGYETGFSNAERKWIIIVLALSFSIVIILIALLDRSQSTIIPISQQPLIDLRASMEENY